MNGGNMWGLDIELLEGDLYKRLDIVTDTRLKVESAHIVNAFSNWLADNELCVVNEDGELFEL